MSNNWILFYVFLMFVATSIFTYHKPLKDSWGFLPLMISTALLGSWLWVVASRRLDKVADLVWFSIVWDLLMMAAYYLIPLLLFEHKMTLQSWGALGIILIGIVWFKLESGI